MSMQSDELKSLIRNSYLNRRIIAFGWGVPGVVNSLLFMINFLRSQYDLDFLVITNRGSHKAEYLKNNIDVILIGTTGMSAAEEVFVGSSSCLNKDFRHFLSLHVQSDVNVSI